MIEVKRVTDTNLWQVLANGEPLAALLGHELDELAQALAFRLEGRGVVPGPTGVELRVGASATVHLCYSDEAEQFTKGVTAAAGACGVTV